MHPIRNLFFDIHITGHHPEYLGHLIDYLHKKGGNKDLYFFIVHPEFSTHFPEIAGKAEKIINLTWQEITTDEFNAVKGNTIKTSLCAYWLMRRYAKKYNVNHVFALDFHAIKYGGIFFRTPFTISSILFVQFYRLDKSSVKNRWIYYKRYHLTKLCLLNKKINRVFILNDEVTTRFMNNEFKTSVFKILPDPISSHQPLKDFEIYDYYKINRGRKIFLHVGSLGNRKGTMEVIDSVNYLAEINQKNIAILLVGKAGNPEESKIIRRKIKINKQKTNVHLTWDERFVPMRLMKSLFEQCYAVLIPYKNAEYSSGILGHAAAARKMVIATGSGLLKEIVLQNKLGVLIDYPNAQEISIKISELMVSEHIPPEPSNFIAERDPMVFAKIIIESLEAKVMVNS